MITRSQCSALILLGLLFLGAWGVQRMSPQTSYLPTSAALGEAETRESYWKERIAVVGGKKSYQEFSESVEGLPIQNQHTRVHEFGGALYEIEGLLGLSVCDARFSYGCFHEFLGRAIARLGISSLPELNERCFEALGSKGLSCQHGIGHGVQAYFGYSEKDLFEALATCDGLVHRDLIGGCFGGVFMEYNFQTMLGEEGRVRLSESIFSPCDYIAEAYKKACVFSHPQWWRALLHNQAEEEVYRTMGTRCRDFTSALLLRTCFEGIGNITGEAAGFNIFKTIELCDFASETPEERLLCRSFAANGFFVDAGGESKALAVCDGFSGGSLSYCEMYARNRANIFNPLALPQSL